MTLAKLDDLLCAYPRLGIAIGMGFMYYTVELFKYTKHAFDGEVNARISNNNSVHNLYSLINEMRDDIYKINDQAAALSETQLSKNIKKIMQDQSRDSDILMDLISRVNTLEKNMQNKHK